jgi:epoxyqueuosine reductase
VNLKQTIEQEARRLGFALAGFTTPEPPPHVQVWRNWLDRGLHGTMNYMADPRRADPRLLFPECKTILVLAICYPRPNPLSHWERGLGEGSIAAYAWGMDYHVVMQKKLEALTAFIAQQANQPITYRWYTDTGPMLERELAQRAGLGWIGKNTCLINPKIGSYFFLAEILLSLVVEPNAPFTANRCGTCTRCINTCPTGAILPDRTIDARRCISYLTIENKGSIPPDLRQKMGNWVFGCDLCQMACPWNQHIGSDFDPSFAPRTGILSPKLVPDLALTSQEFNRKFKDSPIQRTKRRGYLRNIAVVLGNSSAPGSIPALEKALQDDEPLVREHAAWALEQIK